MPASELPMPGREWPVLDVLDSLVAEAGRQLAVCNACRYCAGYCPVWPEVELRTEFGPGDAVYLANLCHDCQDCFTACMYTAPHEFDLDPPRLFAQLREETYRRYAWPRRFPRWAGGWAGVVVAYAGVLLLLVVLHLLLAPARPSRSGSPYEVLPHPIMVIVTAVPALWGAAVPTWGALRCWRGMGGSWGGLLRVRTWAGSIGQAVQLRHMQGGGAGCDYPAGAPSAARRAFHLVLVYGFGLCGVSTLAAAFQQEILGLLPPYPYLSVPVVTGTVGGVGMLAGGAGLLALKTAADPARTTPGMRDADRGLLLALLILAVTGLLTLLVRGSGAFPVVLLAHLAAVILAFAVAPYTKFVHWTYRLLAIHKHNLDNPAPAAAGRAS